MEIRCKNHKFSDAHWYCKKCNTSYCFSCAEKKHFNFEKKETFVHVCPECRRMLSWVGVDYITDTQGKSVLKSFLYPFSVQSLTVLAILIGFALFLSNNLVVNEILFGLIWIGAMSYSQNVLSKTLKGKNQSPKFTSIPIPELINHIFSVFKQSLVLLLVCTLVLMTAYVKIPLIPIFILMVSSFFLPYGIMKSVTSKQFSSYVNVHQFISVIKKVALTYVVTVVLFIPVLSLFYLILNFQPKLIIPVICYFMVVIHRMIGQMILRCHHELDFPLNYEDFKTRYSLETLHGFKT